MLCAGGARPRRLGPMQPLDSDSDRALSAGPAPGMPTAGERVLDTRGVQALVVDPANAPAGTVLLCLEDGAMVRLPADLLAQADEGGYRCAVGFDTLKAAAEPTGDASQRMLIPVIAESIDVSKRVVNRGGWRIAKTVETHHETVDLPLMRDEVSVERVAVNQLLQSDATPGVRQDGDTMVVPIFEEVLVVEKRLMLKEELRIHRVRKEFHAPQSIELRRERVSVQRIGADGAPVADQAPAAFQEAAPTIPSRNLHPQTTGE